MAFTSERFSTVFIHKMLKRCENILENLSTWLIIYQLSLEKIFNEDEDEQQSGFCVFKEKYCLLIKVDRQKLTHTNVKPINTTAIKYICLFHHNTKLTGALYPRHIKILKFD